MSASHSRASSEDTVSSSSGSSFNLILEHILTYPGSYEIPLRTMYTLNCAPRAQPLPNQRTQAGSPTPSAGPSPTATQFPRQEHSLAAAQFTSSLMTQISQLPSQPCSLPPSFINSFARRCFAPVLTDVDFPQSLTALDYIKDLEMRRRRDLASALHRLGIERDTLGTDADDFSNRYPGVATWVRAMEEKERKIEALYTQLFIAVRRWILINEMSLEPFNKYNCVAMLNTLYPPVVSSQPTSKLTPAILKSQRDGFFRYIQEVERRGPQILDRLMQQGKKAGDKDGWAEVAKTVDMYLRVACSVIDECAEVTSTDSFATADKSNRKGRKVDSGISFGSGDKSRRPSASESVTSTTKGKYSPSLVSTNSLVSATPSKGGSTLEKIARELRRMGKRSKVEVEEIAKPPSPTDMSPSVPQTPVGGAELQRRRTLRKMKSVSALGDLKHANSSSVSINGTKSRMPSDTPSFEREEMLRQRMLYEARAAKAGGA